MRFFLKTTAVLLVFPAILLAQGATYHLGTAPTNEQMKNWDIAITPDGQGLPSGSGSAKEGAEIYKQKCAACHGPTATEGPATALVGGLDTLKTATPKKTVNYWPFTTTVWDYINRAMPMDKELTLKPDEVYALTAFLLYRNGIIKEDAVMDAKSLPKVVMPNRRGFVPENINEIKDWKKRGCRLGNCP